MNIKLISFISLFVVSVSANASLVDLFSTSQAELEDSTLADGGLSSQAGLGDPTILGGSRDLYVELLSNGGVAGRDASIGVAGGVMDFSTDSLADGIGAIVWDGANAVTNPFATDVMGGVDSDGLGAGGVDLTQGGTADAFELLTLFSDGSFLFTVTAWNAVTGASTALTLASSAVAVPTPSSILFAAFSGLCDGSADGMGAVISIVCSDGAGGVGVDGLTEVGALSVVLNVSGVTSIDLTIDSIKKRVVPEPSSLALMGIALFAAGLRRKPANA